MTTTSVSTNAEFQTAIDNCASRNAQLTLSYLTSYAGGMGRAALRCTGCRCDTTELDAHSPGTKASVFVSKTVDVLDAHRPGCIASLRLLESTSSDGHKFKVRFVTFAASGDRERRAVL